MYNLIDINRQFSGVVVDYFFDRKELFYFVDDIFDSEYVQVQVVVQQVQNWKHVYASKEEIVRGGEEYGFDSKEDEVVPKVKDMSLVDGVFDGAFRGDRDGDFSIGEGGFEKTCGTVFDKELTKRAGKECEHERHRRHFHQYHCRCNERMRDWKRRRKRKRRLKDDLFLCHYPFASFAHGEEREET
nr:hypothetical protein [Tanacetum cinerariifolium]